MASRIEKAVAFSIFKLVKQGGYVPPNVLASAGRIVRGKGDAQDMNRVRDFKGIRQSGATASKQALRDFSGPVGQIGHAATLASITMQGGATGAGAGFALAQRMASMADGFSRSPAFRELLTRVMTGPQVGKAIEQQLTKAYGKNLFQAAERLRQLKKRSSEIGAPLTQEIQGAEIDALLARQKHSARSKIVQRTTELRSMAARTPAQEAELQSLMSTSKAITAQSVKGTSMAYGIGRVARVVSASAGYIMAGVAATKGIMAMGEAAGGDWTERTRLARSSQRLMESDPTQWRQARIERERLEEHERERTALMHPGRYFGLRGGGRRIEEMQTSEDMRNAGLAGKYDVENLRQFAWKRGTNDTYMGRVWGGLKSAAEWVSPSMFAEDKTKAAQTVIGRATSLRSQGYAEAATGMIGTAQAHFEEANKELEGVGKWESWNSARIYKEVLAGQEADHWWARSQMRKAGPRTGD
jgi:hypothetical protein